VSLVDPDTGPPIPVEADAGKVLSEQGDLQGSIFTLVLSQKARWR
jgi:hypothetical protein